MEFRWNLKRTADAKSKTYPPYGRMRWYVKEEKKELVYRYAPATGVFESIIHRNRDEKFSRFPYMLSVLFSLYFEPVPSDKFIQYWLEPEHTQHLAKLCVLLNFPTTRRIIVYTSHGGGKTQNYELPATGKVFLSIINLAKKQFLLNKICFKKYRYAFVSKNKKA